MQSAVCVVCGNDVPEGMGQCPYCQAEFSGTRVDRGGPQQKTVNLKKGMPLVQQALDRLDSEITLAVSQGYKVITLIHGYGSSGEGGAIKAAVLRQCEFLIHKGRIKGLVAGETFEGRSARGRQLLRSYPFLAEHRDLNRVNPGITLVLL